MRVLVTGAHGLVGQQLLKLLSSEGHQVVRLVRSYPEQGDILWDPRKRIVELERLEGFDAVVNLAGDNIASGRWTAAKKAEIRNSRIEGTSFLSESLASLKNPPAVMVSASAIGFYGDRKDELLTEESTSGTGFLAEVCREWEAATTAAQARGIRVVNLRIGVVLTQEGGALSKMLLPFQMGAGGILGSGKQFMSWIALDDLVSAISHCIQKQDLKGPVNAVSPNAVTNKQFTAALGNALHRPTIFPVPGFAAHLLLGEMADELLLASALVKPSKLVSSGFVFKHPDIFVFLKQLLQAA